MPDKKSGKAKQKKRDRINKIYGGHKDYAKIKRAKRLAKKNIK